MIYMGAEMGNLDRIINSDARPDVKAVLRNEEPRFNIPMPHTPNVHLPELGLMVQSANGNLSGIILSP